MTHCHFGGSECRMTSLSARRTIYKKRGLAPVAGSEKFPVITTYHSKFCLDFHLKRVITSYLKLVIISAMDTPFFNVSHSLVLFSK